MRSATARINSSSVWRLRRYEMSGVKSGRGSSTVGFCSAIYTPIENFLQSKIAPKNDGTGLRIRVLCSPHTDRGASGPVIASTSLGCGKDGLKRDFREDWSWH